MRTVIASRTSRGRGAVADSSESDAAAQRARPRPGRLSRVRDAVTTVLALLGVLVILWLIASWAFSLSLVVVLTGSMSPDIPAGSAVISHRVAASDLREGDVVTVPREGYSIPVTHRIVTIEDAGGPARSLILRGDANPISDPDPYVVTEAGRVVAAVPVIGYVVRWVTSGPGTLIVIVLAAMTVTAVLWPTRDAASDDRADDADPTPDEGVPAEPEEDLTALFATNADAAVPRQGSQT